MIEIATAFALMFMLDFIYAAYTRNIADGNKLKSSSWASALIVVNGGVVLSYVGNPWMLVPIAAGAFCGTYAEMWLRQWRNERRIMKKWFEQNGWRLNAADRNRRMDG